MRRMNPLFLVLALLVLVFPASAHASLKIAGGKAKREKWETMPRKGIYLGTTFRPGAAGFANTFAPALNNQWEIGGGVSDHFTLGVSLGGTAYLGLGQNAFNADLVGHRFIGKGLFVRGAAGVTSMAPSVAPVPMSPALGGALGLGYEFRVLERIGVSLGVDYDLKMRMDRRMSQTWLVGVRFAAYLNKKR